MRGKDDAETKPSPNEKPELFEDPADVSRREFLKISGISLAIPLVVGPPVAKAAGREVPVYGPGKVAMTFRINDKEFAAALEPRVTLLDALRDQFGLTGAKRVCDRGECGACTVLMDRKAVYACSVLAIEAQTAEIRTVESLARTNHLHPIQRAFVNNDASQCGFCTPGFVVACSAFLDEHPSPTPEDIRRGLSGNFCRCGTYDGIKKAIVEAQRRGA